MSQKKNDLWAVLRVLIFLEQTDLLVPKLINTFSAMRDTGFSLVKAQLSAKIKKPLISSRCFILIWFASEMTSSFAWRFLRILSRFAAPIFFSKDFIQSKMKSFLNWNLS